MTSNRGIDPRILHAWLSGRSVARGIAQPVAEYGGFRVDSNSDIEVKRWVFPRLAAGLTMLGHLIGEPRHFLKVCGEADELRAALPHRWQLHDPGHFMQSSGELFPGALTKGYRTEVDRVGPVTEVRIWADTGVLAASGYAGETRDAFVYDRIVTAPEHRRKGLGRAVMATLRAAKQHLSSHELLVATPEGQALYARLGWRTISPYSTASIAKP